ncbi:MAG: diguanylate cyclase [Lachnospiraceae bacterium]|nr:diguanylate cyclase [Lachnospiraceae bacterium]
MYYAAIGTLALLILLIENQDILLKPDKAFSKPAWKVYRRFLYAVLIYYVTDILWGILEDHKLAVLLFADTSVYFIVMAAGILFWTQYVVTYTEEDNGFSRFLIVAGRIVAVMVTLLSLVNIFVPVLFTVDESCSYRPLATRYAVLGGQILLLLLISVYSLLSILKKHPDAGKRKRYAIIARFGVIMALFLLAQIWFPYLPLYGIAYLLGTCLLRSGVIRYEQEEYRLELEEAEKIRVLKQSVSALLDNMPALSFSKDAESGVYLACNQAFAEYAHKEDPEGVIGLTDAQIFDAVTASHFVEDDRMALSMDEPYIFFEDVPDAVGNQRQFQTTKLKFIDTTGRLCTLGMCQDVTDMVRIQRENATTKEAYERARSNAIIYTHIAQALANGYEDLYYVNLESGEFIEYRTDAETGSLKELRRGEDFFETCLLESKKTIHPEDRDGLLKALEKKTLVENLDRNGSFVMSYRMLSEGEYMYVRIKASRMKDDERYIILGITDVDEEIRQQRATERVREEHIAYSRLNALAGDFVCVYVVDPESGYFRELSTSDIFKFFGMPKEGDDFFGISRERGSEGIVPEDRERFLASYTRENVLSEAENGGIFALTFRLPMNGRSNYVQLKAALVDEKDGRRLVVGINNIDGFVRQEEDYAKRLAHAQSMANTDALTGVKTKHAYQEDEAKLNRQIAEDMDTKFAIVILDVNELKKINDTEGHQAGDEYLRGACKIICDTFKRSPVYRVGGDEFAVLVRGEDYACIDELTGRIAEHNEEARRTGGIVIACGMSKYERDGSVAPVFERADQKMYENKSELKR